MNRYRETDINNKVYNTTYFHKSKKGENDIYIYTKEGDRLDVIARKYYNDKTLWWVIALCNDNLSSDSLYVEGGERIRIPKPYTNVTDNINK